MPFDHKEGVYPLGHWVSEMRKAYGAGTMDGARVQRLEALGMIWDAADHAFAEGLAAARAYFADHGTLAAPRSATALDRPLGQWLSNLRRPGALAGHPGRAEALAAIDPDWNPAWPLDWQRHYAAVRECLAGGAQLADLLPGVTIHGHDIGRWLERQRQPVVWQGLMPEQRKRLAELGVEPLAAATASDGQKKAPKGAGGPSAAFERGLAALRQYKAREGHLAVPRAHIEVLESAAANGSSDNSAAEPIQIRLGVWISNTKSRRAKLTTDKLAQLAELGVEWV